MKYAVYSSLGWLQDTCAGGVFSWDIDEAIYFDTVDDAWAALRAAEIVLIGLGVLRVK